MVRSVLLILAFALGLTSARFFPRDDATDSTVHRLLVGASGQLVGIDFDGATFSPRPNANVSETGKVASWMVFKEPNLLYTVDENSNATRLFNYDPKTGQLSTETAAWNGSTGTVHLTFTQGKERLIGSSYSQGQIDIWNSDAADGTLTILKRVPLEGEHGPDSKSQTQLRAHQSVLDPTGRFLIVNDLGGDILHIIDSKADAFTPLNAVKIDAGSGPRHGAFLQLDGGDKASHYVVVCELSNMVHLFSVSYADATKGLTLKQTDAKSTYGPGFPPKDAASAAAGELVVAKSGAIYVSNRLSGNETDSISHFALEKKAADDTTPVLTFKSQASSGGIAPRMMSLSKDEKVMFVSNVNGVNGLVALSRDASTGMLGHEPLGVMTNEAFAPEQPKDRGYGPML